MLCYGQIVASVHVVGHFQGDECNVNASSLTESCHAAEHESSELLFAAVGHDHHTDHDNHDNHTAMDCAIYHALLSLNGVVYAVPGDLEFPQRIVASPERSAPDVVSAALENQQIRAPPAIS